MKYEFNRIERKWQDRWAKENCYHAVTGDSKPKFYALVEFPYPSGQGLHVGHARPYTAMDVVARKRRMDGYNVLFPMGYDAFGLPTENYAIKNHIHPAKVTHDNIQNFTNQLKMLGYSFDWDRVVDTTDPNYYKWTQWIFLQLFKKGLAYKTSMPVNWCTSCKCVLANEEVVNGVCERCGSEVVRKEKSQWMLKITQYAQRLIDDLDDLDFIERVKIQQKNWIGRSTGAEVTFPTTQGDNLVVYTTRPDTLFGATYMVLAPEHPYIEKWKNAISNWDAVTAYVEAAAHKSDFERTELVKEKTGVKLEGVRGVNPVNGKEIPIFISDYVLVSYGMTVKDAIPAMKKWLEEKGIGHEKVNYKLRDWVFSRQRYWGEPIPLVHCDKCGWVPLPEDQLPLLLPEVESYEPTDNGESPLAAMTDWVNTTCPCCGGPAQRETDTMPQWAGSSWYFLRYMDPHNDKALASPEALKYWGQVDWYNGGMEHTTLHLLYSRFWHKFLYDLGVVPFPEPYHKRTSHGMILGEGGEKMSKSRGNVVNPNDVVAQYGADTMRMYIMFIGDFEKAAAWSDNAVKGCKRFLDRIWNLADQVKEGDTYSKDNEALVHKTIKKVSDDIENMKFNTAIAALMTLTNQFYDKGVNRAEFQTLLLLLSPFAPHIVEELWERFGLEGMACTSSWPAYDESKTIASEVTIAVQVGGKLKATVTVPMNSDQEAVLEVVKAEPKIAKLMEGKNLVKVIHVPNKLMNLILK